METQKNRLALVTGASYGIGRAVALGLARIGYDLVLTARSEQMLKETAAVVSASGQQAWIVVADLSRKSDRDRIIAAVGKQAAPLAVLVHGAAGKTDPENDAELTNTSDETIDAIISTTIAGTIYLTKQLLPSLEAGAPSNIIFLASDWALKGSHGPAVFSSAKAAVAQFAHTLRRGLAARRISTTVIYPGDVASFDADWAEPKWQLDDALEEVKAELGDTRIPLVDIVESVIFVVSRKMSRVEELWIAPLSPDYDY